MPKLIPGLIVLSLLVAGNATAQGQLAAPGGTIAQGPSSEVRENVIALTEREAFGALGDLSPVKFTYRYDPTGDLQVGFMAEQMPDLLSVPGRGTVAPLDIIAVLTKVVQRQQAAISALEQRIRLLEGGID